MQLGQSTIILLKNFNGLIVKTGKDRPFLLLNMGIRLRIHYWLLVIFPINYGIVTGDAHMKVTGRLFFDTDSPEYSGDGAAGGTEFHTFNEGRNGQPFGLSFSVNKWSVRILERRA